MRRALRAQPRQHATPSVVALPFDEWQAWYDREAQEIKDAEQYAADEREQVQQSEGEAATSGTSGASNVESESEESE